MGVVVIIAIMLPRAMSHSEDNQLIRGGNVVVVVRGKEQGSGKWRSVLIAGVFVEQQHLLWTWGWEICRC